MSGVSFFNDLCGSSSSLRFNISVMRTWLLVMFVMLGSSALPVAAQDARGTITGTVTDASGGVVPGANVAITNIATNAPTSTATTGEGTYTVAVEASGYKRLVRENVEVRVGDRVTLDLALETGEVGETVTISSENTPLIEAASASMGQVVDRRRVAELPLADGNPFALARLASGVTPFNFNPEATQPFSNSDPSSITTNGAQGGNEYTLDGATNTVDERPGIGNRVGVQPPADTVQEFKVTTSSFDAQQGHTAGATIDVATRGGSNRFSGTLYEFVRNDVLTANTFSANATAPLGFDDNGNARRAPRRYNRFGGTIGGPLFLPRFGEGGDAFYSGRDRTFFFASYEKIKTNTPSPFIGTVPTLAQRGGNFSALLSNPLTVTINRDGSCAGARGAVVPVINRDGSVARLGQIYDPATAVSVRRCNPRTGNIETRIERLPFAGNIIPNNRISNVARSFLNFFPAPNAVGDAQGRNNFSGVSASINNYDFISGRIDHTISERQRVFFRYTIGDRSETDENVTGITNGIRATGFDETRTNNNLVGDYVVNLTPTTILNLRGSFGRFYNVEANASADELDSSTLGFPPATAALFGGGSGLPRFDISNFIELGGRSPDTVANSNFTIQPNLTKVAGNQTLRAGYDFRVYRENSTPPGDVAGRYRFRQDFTRQNDSTASNQPFGAELAAFLLGIPASNSTIQRVASRSNQNVYHGIYFQDDWKVTQRLTLNLGLRYEYEAPTTERFNRNLRLFDSETASPIEAQAQAAYATNFAANPANFPIAPGNFRVRGGVLFTDENNRDFYEADKNNFQPRLGFAYQINDKTVVRGGYAIYNAPFTIDGVNQTGFSQVTSVVPTNDNGLTFISSFENPFPNGVVEPVGANFGLASFIGTTLGGTLNLTGGDIITQIDRRVAPLTIGARKNPKIHRMQFSFQRELPGRFLVDLAYIGSRGRDLTTFVDLNPIPQQFLATDPTNNASIASFLETNVANPFRNIEAARGTAFFTSSTIQRQQLLRPFPQYQSIIAQRHDGRSSYDSGQLRIERRFAQGFTFQTSYTYSKFLEELTLLNPTDTEYEKRLSSQDAPHRLALSSIYELPFGRGRRFGGDVSRLTDALIGGLQLGVIYQYQSGLPYTLPNLILNGDINQLRSEVSSSTLNAVFDTSLFNRTAVTPIYTLRTLPSRLNNFRGDEYSNVDLSVLKNIGFSENVRLQLRAEFFNLFNKPLFLASPSFDNRAASFGALQGDQVNIPRELQLGIKLIF